MPAERLLLAGGAVGIAIALAAMFAAPAAGLHAWLAAAFFCGGVPVGSLGLAMMIRLIPGRWGWELLLPAEAGTLLVPAAALAAVPVLIGMGWLYPWVHEPETGFKAGWLSPLPFVARTLLWFAGLAALALLLAFRRAAAAPVSAAGLIFLALGGSVIAFDWLLSLSPDFNSSGFGLYALAIHFKTAMMAAMLFALACRPGKPGVLGGLMLAMLALWAYFLFMPYLIGWSGNLLHIAPWWLRRGSGGWGSAVAVAVGLQAIPLLLLLLPAARRSPRALRTFAVLVLAGTALESAWLTIPEAGGDQGLAAFLFVPAALGLGLLFLSAQIRAFRFRIAARSPERTR